MRIVIFLSIFFAALSLNFGKNAFAQEITLKFNSTSQMEGETIRTTSFVKGSKIRMEMQMMGQSSVFISDGEKAYMYTPSTGVAMEIPIANVYGQLPVNKDYKEIPGLTKTGQETLNNRVCDIYEYSQSGAQHKIWVAQDIDFPIKEEATTPKGVMVTTIDNVEKGIQLSDSLFVLPAGVSVTDSGDIMNKLQGAIK